MAEIEEDYKHPKLLHQSEFNMELDIYVEDLKLAVEYQGEHHYKPVYYSSTDLEAQRIKDEEKRRACKQVEYLAENYLPEKAQDYLD